MMPLEAMQEEGYECEIFSINSQVKIEDDPHFISWVKVIYYRNIFQYLSYLWRNRNAIIYSNSLTIKTLLVGLIGRRTVFIPHDSIFGSNWAKRIIIKFFYFFFGKIRLNNDSEVYAVNAIRKKLWVKIPLVVSDFFYNFWNARIQPENIFISLWNIVPKKQPELLLQALKTLKDKWYTFKLRVIGEDRLWEFYNYTYSSLLKKYGLENEVEVLWYQPHTQLPSLLNWASLYVNTSKQEGLCLAVYECALSWLQTILPNILSFNNIFGKDGLYYQKESVQDLVEKIEYFLQHKEVFVNKIRNTQQYILKNNSYLSIKNALKDLFKTFE